MGVWGGFRRRELTHVSWAGSGGWRLGEMWRRPYGGPWSGAALGRGRSLCRRRPWACCFCGWGLLLEWGAFCASCVGLFPVVYPFRHLKRIMAKRVLVQWVRKVPDSVVRRYMVPYCGDIWRFLRELFNRGSVPTSDSLALFVY